MLSLELRRGGNFSRYGVYYLQCSPDGVIYDANTNKMVKLVEVKSPQYFNTTGARMAEYLEQKNCFLRENKDGLLELKPSSTVYH